MKGARSVAQHSLNLVCTGSWFDPQQHKMKTSTIKLETHARKRVRKKWQPCSSSLDKVWFKVNGSFLLLYLAKWEQRGISLRENSHRMGRPYGNQKERVYRLSSSEGTSTSSVLGETQDSSPLEWRDGPGG